MSIHRFRGHSKAVLQFAQLGAREACLPGRVHGRARSRTMGRARGRRERRGDAGGEDVFAEEEFLGVNGVAALRAGGVQVVMITGDAEETALSIARALGLRVGTGSNSGCLTGQAIDRLSKQQLREMVGSVSVFARTTPKHKMAIVEAFQSRGAVVAMTGDGGEYTEFLMRSSY